MEYSKVFTRKPVIATIYMAGKDPVANALVEMRTFKTYGVDAVVIENRFCSKNNIENLFQELQKPENKIDIKKGVNILQQEGTNKEYLEAFKLARAYGLDFIVIDAIAGKYQLNDEDREVNNFIELDITGYEQERKNNEGILVLGGLCPEYLIIFDCKELNSNISDAGKRSDAMMVRPNGKNDMHAHREKIGQYKSKTGKPIIFSSRVDESNVYQLMLYSNGVIISDALRIRKDPQKIVDTINLGNIMTMANAGRNQNQ